MTDYLHRLVVAPGLDHVGVLNHGRDLSWLRCEQEEREDDNDNALPQPEIEERRLETGILDHRLDGGNGECGAGAEAGGGDAGGEASLVREPLQRVADAGAVDAARADASDDHSAIITVKCGRFGVDRPSDRAKDAANENDKAGTILIDKPAFDRNQPGFEQNEKREGPLDRGAVPSEFLLDVWD